MRIAILSTPRSGNTWLRHLLASLFDLWQHAVHRPSDLDWDALPERAVVQLHWHRVEPLVSLVEQHRFRVAVLARHPLDTLISLLSWVNNCPEPRRLWTDFASLDGDGGDEMPLLDLNPCSQGFAEYATGMRARKLLSVSLQWWEDPASLRIRYESLVQDTAGILESLAETLVEPPRRPIAEVVEASSMEGLRQAHSERSLHFWQGRPGLWRQLLPANTARRIAHELQDVFDRFGYTCDPDESLSEDRAVANWYRLQYESHRLDRERKRKRRSDAPTEPSRGGEGEGKTGPGQDQLAEVLRLLYEERISHQVTAAALAATRDQLDHVHRLLYESRLALDHSGRRRAEAG